MRIRIFRAVSGLRQGSGRFLLNRFSYGLTVFVPLSGKARLSAELALLFLMAADDYLLVKRRHRSLQHIDNMGVGAYEHAPGVRLTARKICSAASSGVVRAS